QRPAGPGGPTLLPGELGELVRDRPALGDRATTGHRSRPATLGAGPRVERVADRLHGGAPTGRGREEERLQVPRPDRATTAELLPGAPPARRGEGRTHVGPLVARLGRTLDEQEDQGRQSAGDGDP